MVIFSKNTVHSILYLVLVFCNATALILLLNLDYIAMVYIVVYVGAIAILFLFVVMMLNIKLLEIKENFWIYTPLVLFVGTVLFVEFFYLFNSSSVNLVSISKSDGDFFINFKDLVFNDKLHVDNNVPTNDTCVDSFNYYDWINAITGYDNIQSVGLVLYSSFFLPFIILAFLLLSAMLGSILLTLRESLLTKRQDIFKQIQADFDKTINIK